MSDTQDARDIRDSILSGIERTRTTRLPRPHYRPPVPVTTDMVGLFWAKARAEGAQIVGLAARDDAPVTIGVTLMEARAKPRLHIPPRSPLRALPWKARTPHLTITDEVPGPDDNALSIADYAIAETGTLVFFSARLRPASWHFLPGREFVLLSRAQVLPSLEDVMGLARTQTMPSTVNLVTGPSRTGDIEQAIEIGAHGPRHLHILLAP